jgi:hypothetical protein
MRHKPKPKKPKPGAERAPRAKQTEPIIMILEDDGEADYPESATEQRLLSIIWDHDDGGEG